MTETGQPRSSKNWHIASEAEEQLLEWGKSIITQNQSRSIKGLKRESSFPCKSLGKSEEQFPQDAVGQLSANSRPTVGRLLVDC